MEPTMPATTNRSSRATARALFVGVVLAALGVTAVPGAQSGSDVVTRYREANGPRILREFATLLSYPNRARDKDDIERAAGYIRDQLQSVGVTSELLRVGDAPPIVYGRLTTPGATRTLGIYLHYDGQPLHPT